VSGSGRALPRGGRWSRLVGPTYRWKKEGEKIPFWVWALLGWDRFWGWAESVPCGLLFFLYFFSFSIFWFLICFIYFANFDSKQFKQISKFFKSLVQCFKPVSNKFSKIKHDF
jgi:hypothetical protein